MNDIHEIIEAFADSEPVDPARLKEALATAEGREHLIDVLVLRGVVRGGPGGASKLAAKLEAPRVSRGRWLSVAAAVAALSLAGGYYAGRQSGTVVQEGPPDAVLDTAAPEPTRVIRLEDSADWIDRAGSD
jgi:hypothetical protein